MKTSEQTKRTISVGLINAARAVIVSAATLFCGVTSARAQEHDNRIDWRWGRPGVMVVTNAPTAVTVTNIATDVAGGVAEGLFGPRVTALEGALDGGTNNWNTAFGWGNHAGLYKAIGWVPSWTEVTGKPNLFDWNYDSLTNKPATFPPSTHTHPYTEITDPPWLTSFIEQDEIALQAVFTHTNNDAIHLSTEQAERIANAVTNEQDLAALRAYHYGSPDIIESPAEWFQFDGAGNITGFNWEAGRENVVIPWAIGGEPVTGIGDYAFAYCTSLTSVNIPNSVTSIGDDVFTACTSLTSVNIPNSVTSVGSGAFVACTSLTSVNIPNSVTSIGEFTLADCTSLTSVNIPNSVTSIGHGAFASCTSLTSVAIGNSVTSIGDYAFAYCTSLTSVNIPNSVTSIGDDVFTACTSLTSLYFNGNAPTIVPDIFLEIPANQVTNYVTNPQATGWDTTLGGMPVVRLDLYGDKIYQAGELVATEAHVAQAIAGKVDAVSGLASNLWLQGETIVSDSYTNLWWRNVYSNGWHWLVAYTNAPGGDE